MSTADIPVLDNRAEVEPGQVFQNKYLPGLVLKVVVGDVMDGAPAHCAKCAGDKLDASWSCGVLPLCCKKQGVFLRYEEVTE